MLTTTSRGRTTTTTTTSPPREKAPSCPLVLEILGLIEQGAAQIEDKQYTQACISLTRALQITKEMLVVEHQRTTVEAADTPAGPCPQESWIDKNHEESPCKDDDMASSSFLCCQVLDLAIATSNRGKEDQEQGAHTTRAEQQWDDQDHCYYHCWLTRSSRGTYAYRTPLVLPCDDQLFHLVGKIPRHDFLLTLLLIIIFNLALSHHFHGICQMKNRGLAAYSSLLLKGAYSLYESTYTLLHKVKREACWFLDLAIVNNVAQILSIIGKNHEAEALLQVVLSGLCCLHQCISVRNNLGGSFVLPMSSFLDVLVHNTCCLILKDVATAPAA